MLTDIFAYRYEQICIWQTFEEAERRLLVQTFQIVSEQLYPYFQNKTIILENKVKWKIIHDKLCRELGLDALSSKTWGYWTKFQGDDFWNSGEYSIEDVSKNFILEAYKGKTAEFKFMGLVVTF